MSELLTPGLYVRPPPRPARVSALRTDVAGFVGWAERGPPGVAVTLESWAQFRAIFGGFFSGLAYAAKAFFDNGGRTLVVVRVVSADTSVASAPGLVATSPGAWGNQLAVRVRETAPETWSVTVLHAGRAVERLVSRDGAPPLAERIAFDALPPEGRTPLRGGRDGLAALAVADLVDGLEVLERVEAIGLVAIPDLVVRPAAAPVYLPPPAPDPVDPCCLSETEPLPIAPVVPVGPEVAPAFSEAEIAWAQAALLDHCARLGDRFALLDPPATLDGVTAWRAWRGRFDSSYGALYVPWIEVVDPARSGALRAVPPSGHVAGLIARTDLDRGVHVAPANAELRWAHGLTHAIDDGRQAELNPFGINAIRAFPGRGLRVFGARTVSSDALWRFVNVRRLMSMIADALRSALQWAVFERHDISLRQRVVVTIDGFLRALFRQGALAGESAAEAFFIRCDGVTNPPDAVERGELHALVGVAPARPAEFVILRLGRVEERLEVFDEGGAAWR